MERCGGGGWAGKSFNPIDRPSIYNWLLLFLGVETWMERWGGRGGRELGKSFKPIVHPYTTRYWFSWGLKHNCSTSLLQIWTDHGNCWQHDFDGTYASSHSTFSTLNLKISGLEFNNILAFCLVALWALLFDLVVVSNCFAPNSCCQRKQHPLPQSTT